MELQAASLLAQKEMDHWLQGMGYTFQFREKAHWYGFHMGRKRCILLNQGYVLVSPEELVLDTIKHEIAHALAWIRHEAGGHCRIWREMCVLVGCKPKRCTKWVCLPTDKFKVVCTVHNGVTSFRSRQISDLSSRWCRQCGESSLGMLRMFPITPEDRQQAAGWIV